MSLDSLDDPDVTIEQGRVRGYYSTDIHGKSFIKFRGIPYAKPPLGLLRFKAPEPPEKWGDLFQAGQEPNDCYHADPFRDDKLVGQEDCLYLNVYTNKLPTEKKPLSKPVLFWIHGGGFTFGSSSEQYYGPHFLMTQNVVLVTINYRLGLLGFLNFRDPSIDIPGNAGLKDQVMALKWVQKNISAFGGDPNNVTIFGQSAGAASAHLLMLSPMATGLFHKVIAQSGCAVNPWVSCEPGVETLAEVMGLEGSDEKTIYEVVKKLRKREIMEIQAQLDHGSAPCERRPLGFVVEVNSRDPFLDKEPIEVLLSGKYKAVPLMIGYTITEGMFLEMVTKQTDGELLNFEHFIPWNFGYEVGSPEAKAVAEQMKRFYESFGQTPEDKQKIRYDVITDSSVLHGIYLTIINTLDKAPVFLYRMSVESKLNFFKRWKKIRLPGVAHFDDIGYLFRNHHTPKLGRKSPEHTYMMRFVKLWTNFARSVTPIPPEDADFFQCVWRVVQSEPFHFLDIGVELTPGTNPDGSRIDFWKKLYGESPAGRENSGRFPPFDPGQRFGLRPRSESVAGSGRSPRLEIGEPSGQRPRLEIGEPSGVQSGTGSGKVDEGGSSSD